jgi:hypothetical protein
MRSLALLCLVVVSCVIASPIYYEDFAMEDDDAVEVARQLMQLNPMIDGHNDLTMQYREQWEDRVFREPTADLDTIVPTLQTDVPRIREGLLSGQFWSVYVDCSHQVGLIEHPYTLIRIKFNGFGNLFSIEMLCEQQWNKSIHFIK